MAVDEDHSKIMERYQLMKRSLKEALLENEVLQEELRRSQTKLMQITKEKQSLMDRLQARYQDQQYSEEYTSDEDVRWQQQSYAKGVYGKPRGGRGGGGGGVSTRGGNRGRGGYSATHRKQQQQQMQHHPQNWSQGPGAGRRKQAPIPTSHFDDGASTSSQEPPAKRKKSFGPHPNAGFLSNRGVAGGSIMTGSVPGAPDDPRYFVQSSNFPHDRHSFVEDSPRGSSGNASGLTAGVTGGMGTVSGSVSVGIYDDSSSFDGKHGSYDDRLQYSDNVYYSINESDDSDEHYYPQHVD